MRRKRKKQIKSNTKNILETFSSLSKMQIPSFKNTEKDMQGVKDNLESTLETLNGAERNGMITNNVLKVVSAYLFLKLLGVNE